MLGFLFGRKKPTGLQDVTASLMARLMPIDRGEIFEDPLHDFLEERGWGEVTGGGTLLTPDNEVGQVDIEISMQVTEESLAGVQKFLEALGAPKGSKLIVGPDGREIPIGKMEGLAVYLNGSELPAEVYQTSDINFVIEELDRLLADEGKILGNWEGPSETALYLYGPSFETMKTRISPFLATYPLCEKCRVVQVA